MEWSKLGNIKLLIVDDDAFNRQLVVSLLSQISTISFIEAEDGLEALSILKQVEVDMILLDLHMPNLNGYDTLEAIKKEPQYEEIPVAILTTDEYEKVKLYALGADDFLSKPYDLSELESRIYIHIETRQRRLKQVAERKEKISKVPKIEFNKNKSTFTIESIEKSQKEIFYNITKLAFQSESEMNSVKVVARLTRTLAELVGYGKKIANNISSASVIRNIGLLSFSKEKPLLEYHFSAENKILYEKYIYTSYQLFTTSTETEFIRITKKIIVQHREHFDGSGFPKQSQGEEIHKVAYIVALVEAFDALLGQKNYHNKIYTAQETYSILESQSGKRFHPEITKHFLEHFEDFILLRKKILSVKQLITT